MSVYSFNLKMWSDMIFVIRKTVIASPPYKEGVANQFLKSSYRDLIAVSKIFIKLDPVVKPRDDVEDRLPSLREAVGAPALTNSDKLAMTQSVKSRSDFKVRSTASSFTMRVFP